MGLFRWKCTKCAYGKRRILAKRPQLDPCPECGAELVFDNQVVGTVYETIDNGYMAKKVQWIKGESDMVEHHSELPDEEEPGIV